MKSLSVFLVIACWQVMSVQCMLEAVNQSVVYQKGELGYFCFRIPVLHLTSKNTLLAFAEGRNTIGCGDHGDVHIVLKRSMDYGKTWSPLSVVHTELSHTIGNPAPVEDKATGRIVLMFSRDNKDILQIESTDDGVTWGDMRDITTMVKLPTWNFIASGPSDGVQLPSGRFVICMYGFVRTFGAGPGSYSVFSDDGGKNWLMSSPTSDISSGECQVVPLDLYSKPSANNTKMLMYMRTSFGTRSFGYSNDSGQSWFNMSQPKSLNPQTSVQGAVLAVPYTGVTFNTHLYVSQPSSLVRTNMHVFHSTDGGYTWKSAYELWKGPSAYSSMVKHHDSPYIYCMYEKGDVYYWESLTLATFQTLI